MTPIEDKLIEEWHEFKIHAQNMVPAKLQEGRRIVGGLEAVCTKWLSYSQWPSRECSGR